MSNNPTIDFLNGWNGLKTQEPRKEDSRSTASPKSVVLAAPGNAAPKLPKPKPQETAKPIKPNIHVSALTPKPVRGAS